MGVSIFRIGWTESDMFERDQRPLSYWLWFETNVWK